MKLAAGALIGCLALGWWLVGGRTTTETDSDVPTFVIESGPFLKQVEAEGNLEAVQATTISPPAQVQGPLRIAWLAEDGTRVAEDEVVVRFDPSDLEQALLDGRSERATADSRISQKTVREDGAIRNLERDAALAGHELEYTSKFQSKDDDVFSRVEIIESEIDAGLAGERQSHATEVASIRRDLSEVELDILAIQRKKAELDIKRAESDLQELLLRAPHDGIFVLKEIWGRVPEVGTTVWAGNPVGEIPQLDDMQAKVFVLEADAGGLEAGMRAQVVLDAHPDRVYEATIKRVDTLAMRRDRRVPVQYFGVVLELATTEAEVMKPGQRVQATLFFDELDDVIAVPRHAIFDLDGRSVVYAWRDGRFVPVDVEVGVAGLGTVVVESGVAVGDRVALRDPTRPAGTSESESAAGGAGPLGGAR